MQHSASPRTTGFVFRQGVGDDFVGYIVAFQPVGRTVIRLQPAHESFPIAWRFHKIDIETRHDRGLVGLNNPADNVFDSPGVRPAQNFLCPNPGAIEQIGIVDALVVAIDEFRIPSDALCSALHRSL